MRSPLSARRLRSRPPRHDRLEPLARFIDLTTAGEEHHFVVYVEGHERPDDEDLELGMLPPEPDVHPSAAMAGFVPPDPWPANGPSPVRPSAAPTAPAPRPARAPGSLHRPHHRR